MCGRYTLRTPASELQAEFELPSAPALSARYNVAPSQVVPIVVGGPERRLELARWGLIPSWAKDEKIAYKMINARGETLHERPSYRAALKSRRCLVPADGFYEWLKGPDGKIPVHLHLQASRPFAIAGLWESWTPPGGGEPVRSCTLITCAASPAVARVHDRMPVILPRAQYARWLAQGELSRTEVEGLLIPYPGDDLQAYQVCALVNSPKNDSPECLAPVG